MRRTGFYPLRIEGYVRSVERGEYPPDHMLAKLVLFLRAVDIGELEIRRENSDVAPIVLNRSQYIILETMMDQASKEKPIRIRDLKHRKGGHSTFYQLLFKFLCENWPNRVAKTIAHRDTSTREIFDIARLAAEQTPHMQSKVGKESIEWPNRSVFSCTTAGGSSPGAGGSPSYILFSERPKWELGTKKKNYVDVANSIPYHAETIVVDESTAQGREDFFAAWQQGCQPGDAYDSLFFPWYIDDRLTIEPPTEFVSTDDERRLCGRAHKEGIEITNGMLAWRRMKIADIGEDLFRQDYPSSPEEAVQGSKGLILTGIRDCLTDDLPFDPTLVAWNQRVGGIDFGYADATVIWTGFYIDRTLWLTDYWRGANTLADAQAEALHLGHTYYCDPSGAQAREELRKSAALRGVKCYLYPAPRIKNVGEDTANEEIKQIIRMVDTDRLRVSVHAAPQLLVECDTLAWNEKTGRIDDRRTEDCGHYDSVMALKYLVMGVVSGDSLKGMKRPEKRISRAKEWSV